MFFLFGVAINEITSNAVSHLHYLLGFGGRAWQQRLDSKHGRSANPCHQKVRNLHLAGSLCLDRRAWQSLSTPTLDSWQPLCLQHWALQFLFALRCQGLAKQAPTLSTKVWWACLAGPEHRLRLSHEFPIRLGLLPSIPKYCTMMRRPPHVESSRFKICNSEAHLCNQIMGQEL